MSVDGFTVCRLALLDPSPAFTRALLMAPDALAPPAPDTALRQRLETVLERFEGAWLDGQQPALDDFLPQHGQDRSALLPELVLIDLECRWKAGQMVRVEPYLSRYPELAISTGAVLRCLAQEFTLRRRREPQLQLVEYQERFPQYRDWLTVLLPAGAGSLEDVGLAPPCRPVVPPGYEILGLLGRGGMGVVYKARCLARNGVVALKMIRDDDPSDPELLARFRSETEVVSRLRHPNIVEIYQVGEYQGRPFLALEYVPDGNLRDRLARGALPAAEAVCLVATLARAVEHVHDRGIVHRDLKPANVLLVERSGERSCLQPKLTDFGLAKRFGVAAGQTPSGQLLGTPGYLAPEQTTGSTRQVGPAADVWALGAILYELLTGTAAFRGDSVLEVLRCIVDEPPIPPRQLVPTLPQQVEDICLQCLDKTPGRRYPSAAALAENLGRCLDGMLTAAAAAG
jgi:hypothetical protein